MEEFVNRQEVIDKLSTWEGKNVIELYGNSNGGKTSTVEKAADEAVANNKIEEEEFIKIELPQNTDRDTLINLINEKFPDFTPETFSDRDRLENYFNRNFSNLMLFFDNTENLSLDFLREFSSWLIDTLYPSVNGLRFKRIILAGRVPLDGYPPFFSGGEAYPYQIYLGPIDHKFVAQLITEILKVEKENIPFELLRDLRFVTAGIPKWLKKTIKGFKGELPNELPQRQGILDKALADIEDKMAQNGVNGEIFEILTQKLFSVRSFDEFGLFGSVFDMKESEVREIRESLFKARFITRYLVMQPVWHYSAYLTDPAIRWILSANKALKELDEFKNIEEKLIILYQERIIAEIRAGNRDEMLMWFSEWLYHVCLLEAFSSYPPDKEQFLENLKEKVETLKSQTEGENSGLRDLQGWKFKTYFKNEFQNDDLWWIFSLFDGDGSSFLKEVNNIIQSFIKL